MSQIHGRRDASRVFTDDELHRAAWPKTDADQALLTEYRRVMDEEIAERHENEAKRIASFASYGASGVLADYPRPWRHESEPGYNEGQSRHRIVAANGKIVTVIGFPAYTGFYRYDGVEKGIAQAICDAVNAKR